MGTSLDRIEIQGFKSIGEAALDLRALNMLIGANGAGKSNFIAVFQLLNQMIEQRLQVQVQRWGGPTPFCTAGSSRRRRWCSA